MTYFVRGYGQNCKVAWQAIYGIAHSRLEETVKAFLDGVVTFDRGSRPNSQRHKTNVAKAWMTLFFYQNWGQNARYTSHQSSKLP